jgi:hypothetical protein
MSQHYSSMGIGRGVYTGDRLFYRPRYATTTPQRIAKSTVLISYNIVSKATQNIKW